MGPPRTGRAAAGRILGNLDCEADFAAAVDRATRGHVRRRNLSRAALETASALATLLRAFARDGDTLWTPAPVAPRRMAEVPGLPRPELESGSLASLAAPGEVLAWGETAAAADHRRRASPRTEADGDRSPLPDAPLHERLWRLPRPDPAVAADLHHRAFALEVASRLGAALPGARIIASPEELEEHLRARDPETAGHDPAATAGRWVLKATLSAAGRWRHVGRGRLAGGETRRVARLFARHGPLLFEPWLERTDDFGVAGLLDSRGARMVGFHRSLVGRRGAFLGLELDAAFSGIRGLDAGERERLEEAFDGVAEALRQRGYSGPFGIDCWRYRRPAGNLCWQPLGEINARMTFGLVARTLVDRLRRPLGLGPRATVRLRLAAGPAASAVGMGRKAEPRADPGGLGPEARLFGALGARPTAPGTVPLLLPAAGQPTAAWLELSA